MNIRARMNVNKCSDGLIFYYCGDGVKDNIILSNGQRYKISDIFKKFNGKECPHLKNKAKIMIYDCCRGNDISETCDVLTQSGSICKGGNEWINSKYDIN